MKDNTFRLLRISNYLVIAFYAIVIAALLIRLVRNVPKAVPLVLLGLAVAAAVLACAARWPDTAGSRSTVSKILLFINSLFMNGGVSLVAMAGIAWLIRTERETKIPVRNQPDETEKPF